MAALASVEELEARWRPLTTSEASVASAWLNTASAIIRSRIANVDTRIADSTDYEDLVIGVAVEMVLRKMRNPDGKRSETIDDYSYTRDESASSGGLFMSTDEVALLSATGAPAGAFSIRTEADPGYAEGREELVWLPWW